MKDLIYYPDFETKNIDWLKFALLYIDKLHPIIPLSADNLQSDLYKKLTSETDLIDIKRPSVKEGRNSSSDAILIVEKIIKNPESYDLLLHEVNIARLWRNKKFHTYKIYGEKYSWEWKDFCLQNGIATETVDGILVAESLANIYMTIFANTMADKWGKELITDKPNISELSYIVKSSAPIETKLLSNAKSIIELKIPKNLSLDDVIKIRNKKDFKVNLSAFQNELEKFYNSIENGTNPNDFIKYLNEIISERNGKIGTSSADIIKYILTTDILLHQTSFTKLELLNTIIINGAATIVSVYNSLNKTWKNTKNAHHCKRYLSSISNK